MHLPSITNRVSLQLYTSRTINVDCKRLCSDRLSKTSYKKRIVRPSMRSSRGGSFRVLIPLEILRLLLHRPDSWTFIIVCGFLGIWLNIRLKNSDKLRLLSLLLHTTRTIVYSIQYTSNKQFFLCTSKPLLYSRFST